MTFLCNKFYLYSAFLKSKAIFQSLITMHYNKHKKHYIVIDKVQTLYNNSTWIIIY